MKISKRYTIFILVLLVVCFVVVIGSSYTFSEAKKVYHKDGVLTYIAINSPTQVTFGFEDEDIILNINAGQFLLDYSEQAKELGLYGHFWTIYSYMSMNNVESDLYYQQGLWDNLVYWDAEKIT